MNLFALRSYAHICACLVTPLLISFHLAGTGFTVVRGGCTVETVTSLALLSVTLACPADYRFEAAMSKTTGLEKFNFMLLGYL